jgi:hypothetical protein
LAWIYGFAVIILNGKAPNIPTLAKQPELVRVGAMMTSARIQASIVWFRSCLCVPDPVWKVLYRWNYWVEIYIHLLNTLLYKTLQLLLNRVRSQQNHDILYSKHGSILSLYIYIRAGKKNFPGSTTWWQKIPLLVLEYFCAKSACA